MRSSIAVRSFWSFSTSKKPPQFADTRFQILGIGDGDFRWHGGKYPRLHCVQNVVAAFVSNAEPKAGSIGAPRGERLYTYLRRESVGFGFAARAGSRRKIVSPSFIRSRRSRATVSR